MKMAEETFYDESSAIFIAKKICNVMSVSEPEACWHGYGERRMAIMNEVHDIMSVNDIVMRRDEKYMELLEQIEDTGLTEPKVLSGESGRTGG